MVEIEGLGSNTLLKRGASVQSSTPLHIDALRGRIRESYPSSVSNKALGTHFLIVFRSFDKLVLANSFQVVLSSSLSYSTITPQISAVSASALAHLR